MVAGRRHKNNIFILFVFYAKCQNNTMIYNYFCLSCITVPHKSWYIKWTWWQFVRVRIFRIFILLCIIFVLYSCLFVCLFVCFFLHPNYRQNFWIEYFSSVLQLHWSIWIDGYHFLFIAMQSLNMQYVLTWLYMCDWYIRCDVPMWDQCHTTCPFLDVTMRKHCKNNIPRVFRKRWTRDNFQL